MLQFLTLINQGEGFSEEKKQVKKKIFAVLMAVLVAGSMVVFAPVPATATVVKPVFDEICVNNVAQTEECGGAATVTSAFSGTAAYIGTIDIGRVDLSLAFDCSSVATVTIDLQDYGGNGTVNITVHKGDIGEPGAVLAWESGAWYDGSSWNSDVYTNNLGVFDGICAVVPQVSFSHCYMYEGNPICTP